MLGYVLLPLQEFFAVPKLEFIIRHNSCLLSLTYLEGPQITISLIKLVKISILLKAKRKLKLDVTSCLVVKLFIKDRTLGDSLVVVCGKLNNLLNRKL